MTQERRWPLYGGNILNKYSIKLLTRALRDLDDIYAYIAKALLAPDTAAKLVGEIEEAIFSLEQFPYRGVERKIGSYASRGYRQLFVQNYALVYRIDEPKQVVIITVRYSPTQF